MVKQKYMTKHVELKDLAEDEDKTPKVEEKKQPEKNETNGNISTMFKQNLKNFFGSSKQTIEKDQTRQSNNIDQSFTSATNFLNIQLKETKNIPEMPVKHEPSVLADVPDEELSKSARYRKNVAVFVEQAKLMQEARDKGEDPVAFKNILQGLIKDKLKKTFEDTYNNSLENIKKQQEKIQEQARQDEKG